MLTACFLLTICKNASYHGPTLVVYTVQSMYQGGSLMLPSSGQQIGVLLLHFLLGERAPVPLVTVVPMLLEFLCTGLILTSVIVFLYAPVLLLFLLQSLLSL